MDERCRKNTHNKQSNANPTFCNDFLCLFSYHFFYRVYLAQLALLKQVCLHGLKMLYLLPSCLAAIITCPMFTGMVTDSKLASVVKLIPFEQYLPLCATLGLPNPEFISPSMVSTHLESGLKNWQVTSPTNRRQKLAKVLFLDGSYVAALKLDAKCMFKKHASNEQSRKCDECIIIMCMTITTIPFFSNTCQH